MTWTATPPWPAWVTAWWRPLAWVSSPLRWGTLLTVCTPCRTPTSPPEDNLPVTCRSYFLFARTSLLLVAGIHNGIFFLRDILWGAFFAVMDWKIVWERGNDVQRRSTWGTASAHDIFAPAYASGPPPVQTDFQLTLPGVGPITSVYLIWGGLDTTTVQRSALWECRWCVTCSVALIGCRSVQLRPQAVWSVWLITPLGNWKLTERFQTSFYFQIWSGDVRTSHPP